MAGCWWLLEAMKQHIFQFLSLRSAWTVRASSFKFLILWQIIRQTCHFLSLSSIFDIWCWLNVGKRDLTQLSSTQLTFTIGLVVQMTLLNFYLWNQAEGTDSIAHSIIIFWLVSVTHQSDVVKLFVCALTTGFCCNILPVLELREPILRLSWGHLLVLQEMHSQHSYDHEFSQSAVHLLTRLHLMFKVFVGFKVCSVLYYLDVC